MNDPSDFEQRLRRLVPTELPDELQRRLHATEPPARTARLLFLHGFLATWFRPWPLAYTGLGAAWAVILTLHLLTQASLPAESSVSLAQSSGGRTNPAPATLTAGFSLDHAFLLTRNNNPDSLWP